MPKRRGRNPAVGAHVSASGGIYKAVERAEKIGAEAIQIFGAAPQQWRRKDHGDDISRFRTDAKAARLGPTFIHAIYLINLASPDDELLAKSIDALTAELRLGSALGVEGVIVHVGSHMGAGFETQLPRIVAGMQSALDDSPDDVWLCLENNAGSGRSVGSTFEELAAMTNGVDNDRVRLCLDTCHLHAAGYDVATERGLREVVEAYRAEFSDDQLVAVHANDSKTQLGSGRDRHENIGQGHIGMRAFRRMVRNRLLRKAVWLLEVPGYESDGPGQADLEILRALRDDPDLPNTPAPPAD